MNGVSRTRAGQLDRQALALGPAKPAHKHLGKPRSPYGAGLSRVPEQGVTVRPGANPDAKLTAAQLALALNVTPQLVNTWHTDGYLNADGERVHLPEAGRNWKGHRLFRYLDGAKAEAATRRSARSYRKPRPARDWDTLNRKPSDADARVG